MRSFFEEDALVDGDWIRLIGGTENSEKDSDDSGG